MISLYAEYGDGVLTIRPKPYMEDGWYIENFSGTNLWKVFEIPQYGGNPNYIDKFESFDSALKRAKSLS